MHSSSIIYIYHYYFDIYFAIIFEYENKIKYNFNIMKIIIKYILNMNFT